MREGSSEEEDSSGAQDHPTADRDAAPGSGTAATSERSSTSGQLLRRPSRPLGSIEPTPVPPPVAIAESPTCEPGKFVVQGKNGLECMTAEERLALLENAEALVAALKAATEVIAPPPPPPSRSRLLLRSWTTWPSTCCWMASAKTSPNSRRLRSSRSIRWGELKKDVLRIDGVLSVHDARLEDNDRRFAKWSSTSFGLGISGAGGAHFLVPYKTPLPFAGGELALYFNITQDLRFLLQAGGGYGGEDYKGNSMGAISALVGIQPQVNDWFHIALGGIMEQRISSSLDFSSYGGFVEPKFCPGNDSDFRFCIGPRVSVVATSGKGPETGKPFTLLDGVPLSPSAAHSCQGRPNCPSCRSSSPYIRPLSH